MKATWVALSAGWTSSRVSGDGGLRGERRGGKDSDSAMEEGTHGTETTVREAGRLEQAGAAHGLGNDLFG